MDNNVTENAALKLAQGLSSCRCCLQREPVKQLNRPYLLNKRTEIYQDMLKECFNINLTADSESCGICIVCVVRLRDANNFKLQVQRSQTELRERLDRALRLLGEPDVNSETDEVRGKEELSDDKPVNLVSEDDGEASDTSDYKPDILLFEADGEASVAPRSVSSCNDDAANVSARTRQQLAMTCSVRLERLRNDITFHQSSNIIDRGKYDESSPEKERFCNDDVEFHQEHNTIDREICIQGRKSDTSEIDNNIPISQTRRISNLQEKIRHIYEMKNISFSNTLNEFKRARIRNKQKVARRTNKQKAYICDYCNIRFTWRGTIIRHMKRQHTRDTNGYTRTQTKLKKRRHECNICGNRYAHKSSLNRHVLSHAIAKSTAVYECHICNMEFPTKDYLAWHIIAIHS